MSKQRVDWPSFIASVVIISAASLALVLFPEDGAELLTVIGYVPNVEQSESTLFGLRFMMIGTPLIMIFLSVWIYKMQYKLHGDFQSRVVQKIARAEVA